MNTKSYKDKRARRIRSISGNRSKDSLLDSDLDENEDRSIVFTQRHINIIDSDNEFSGKPSSHEGAKRLFSKNKIIYILFYDI